MIVFLTGASGVGKTSIVEKMEQAYGDHGFEYFHFDSIGIPSAAEMALIDNWQEQTTHEWIERLINRVGADTIIFEGSTSMEYIRSGFAKYNYEDYLIVLIDCEEATMCKRLIEFRKQPDLVNEDMKNWLRYLRDQAKQFSVESINTSSHTIDEAVNILLEKINAKRKH